MLGVDRRHRILERVAERQSIAFGELAHELGVSEMTIRRDVARLERDGFLRRTYGGASAHLTRSLELAFNARSLQHADTKRLIGVAAAQLVRDVDSLFIGVGTTAEQFALFLAPQPERLMITGSLSVASLLGTRPGRVVILGGKVLQDELSCVGPVAAATVGRYHVDLAVIGAAGISSRFGVTEADDEVAEINRLMVERSDRVMVIADSSKLGTSAPAAVVPITAVHTLVTDEGAAGEQVGELRAHGLHVVVAQPAAQRSKAREGTNGTV